MYRVLGRFDCYKDWRFVPVFPKVSSKNKNKGEAWTEQYKPKDSLGEGEGEKI